MATSEDYLLYHNPTSMGVDYANIAPSGRGLTNKVSVANKVVDSQGIIWCVGRRDWGREKRFYLYHRIVAPVAIENEDDTDFKITLRGQTTFRPRFERDITDEPYFPSLKKRLSLGFQRLTDKDAVEAFQAIYAEAKLREVDVRRLRP